MARPKVYDYDPASDETIVTAGVEGHEITWFGIAVNRGVIHIVCNQGTLSAGGDEIEEVTKSRQQVNVEAGGTIMNVDGVETVVDSTTFNQWYTANKAALDAIARSALETFATAVGKTGAVIET